MIQEESGIPFVPENDTAFRLAQLLLMFVSMRREVESGVTLDRLTMYDFAASNPFIIDDLTSRDETHLKLAGFDPRVLAYASSGQRFASRRERMQHDLSLLISYGFCSASVEDGRIFYRITDSGYVSSAQLTSTYARAYSTAARMVVKKLHRKSDTRLKKDMNTWLEATSGGETAVAIIDVLDFAD